MNPGNCLLSALALALAGCTVDRPAGTPQSDPEVPQVEIGDRAPDLDPTTDDDVDVDTSAPGDT
jgi:hypothetical protein